MNHTGNNNYIEAKIVGSTHIRLQRIDNTISWDKPVHALNWFDSRQLQIYNFYNLLAGRSVKQVGGAPLFKGRLIARVHGTDKDERQVLLVVKYPSPGHFKDMLSNTYFKSVSIIRSLAVKEFTFCLSHSMGDENIPGKRARGENYAVHHFCGDMNVLNNIRDALQKNSLEIAFSSLKTHELYKIAGNKTPERVPAIMDGIVLFKCENENTLNEIVKSEPYQQCLQQSQSSYVGLYQRIL